MRILLMVKTKRMDKLEYIPGDLVMVKKSALQFAKDKIFKVISSLSGGFLKVVMLNDSSTTYSISNNAIRPIPLTPEILEKNGWKNDGYDWYRLPTKRAYLYITKDITTLGEFLVCVGLDRHNLASINFVHQLQHLLFGLGINSEMDGGVGMALEVVVLDKDEYKALIDNQADEDELEYLKACQYALESFNTVRGLCPKCKKSVIIDGFVCPCCGYDSSSEELYKYGD